MSQVTLLTISCWESEYTLPTKSYTITLPNPIFKPTYPSQERAVLTTQAVIYVSQDSPKWAQYIFPFLALNH